jgi:hypothetical protein
LEIKVYANSFDTTEKRWHQVRRFAREIKNKHGIFERLRVSFYFFLRRAELHGRKYGGLKNIPWL